MAQKGYSRFLALIHCVGDVSVLNCAFIFAYILVNRFIAFNDVANEYILLHIVFNLAWAVVTTWQKDTDVSRNTGIEVILWKTLKSVSIHALIIFASIA